MATVSISATRRCARLPRGAYAGLHRMDGADRGPGAPAGRRVPVQRHGRGQPPGRQPALPVRIVTNYRASLARLAALPADVVLPGHPEMSEACSIASARARSSPPGLLRTTVLKARDDFDRELAKQTRAAAEGKK
ncbi:hypothetical protein AB5I41_30060 [Sphingomonas sp. MMS24-JH45]